MHPSEIEFHRRSHVDLAAAFKVDATATDQAKRSQDGFTRTTEDALRYLAALRRRGVSPRCIYLCAAN